MESIKREDVINKIRNKKGAITTNTTHIQTIIKKTMNYELWTIIHKLNNTEEMDKFLETYSLPRLSQEETENLEQTDH